MSYVWYECPKQGKKANIREMMDLLTQAKVQEKEGVKSDLDLKMEVLPMKGEVSSPIEPGDVCRFAKRCPYVTDVCRARAPALREDSPGHFLACARFGKEHAG